MTKKFRLGLMAFVSLALVSGALAQSSKSKKRHTTTAKTTVAHIALTPDEIKWGPAPPALPPGAQVGVLQGDPSKAGAPFHMRVKFPDGYTVPPHWHPTDENVVVFQGTMLLGHGDKFDESATRELPAGSYALMPKGMRHFARAKGDSIIDIYGVGPFEIIYVNPADDPRHKTSR